MTILLLADHDGTALSPATAKALTAALQIGSAVDILVTGHNVQAVADQAAQLQGIRKVLLAQAPHLEHQLAEPVSDTILSLAEGYDAIVAAGTTTGKNILPRVAARLDVMQLSDIVRVIGPETFERPIYAGNAIQTVRATDPKKLLTVRTASFSATPAGGQAPVEPITPPADPLLSSYVGAELSASERPELTAARIVISGGRGLQSAENFRTYLEPLADTLGAALGASRAAVDAGYAPNDLQVGQTGKAVAPELYIAVGISGAIQHLAGMKESRIIVAINKDPDAPIFQSADYGLVGDLFTLLPELQQQLATRT